MLSVEHRHRTIGTVFFPQRRSHEHDDCFVFAKGCSRRLQHGGLQQIMAIKKWREKVRGVERETFDLVFEVVTSEQWVKLLQVPLLQAAAKGKRPRAEEEQGQRSEVRCMLPFEAGMETS